jgi:hypothetical protein
VRAVLRRCADCLAVIAGDMAEFDYDFPIPD